MGGVVLPSPTVPWGLSLCGTVFPLGEMGTCLELPSSYFRIDGFLRLRGQSLWQGFCLYSLSIHAIYVRLAWTVLAHTPHQPSVDTARVNATRSLIR